MAAPLNIITWKGARFVQEKKQEKDCILLKVKLCNAPVLALPEGINDFIVYSDSSDRGLSLIFLCKGGK